MSDASLVSFAEIEALFAQLPDGDDEVADEVLQKLPQGAGKLGVDAVWLARWQGNVKPDMRRPRVALFASTYAPNPQMDATAALVRNTSDEQSLIHRLCQSIDCDLRIYELDLDNAAAAFNDTQAAMNEDECGRAIAYGMMAVEPGIHVLALGDLSPSAAPAMARAMAMLDATQNSLQQLRHYGGYDAAAIFGAMLAARLAHMPVLFSGAVAEFAYKILNNMGLAGHCLQSSRTIADDPNAKLLAELSDLKLAAGLFS